MSTAPELSRLLDSRFRDAIRAAYGAEASGAEHDAQVRVADPRFGDYQVNVAMALSKRLGTPPRAVAEAILATVRLEDVASEMTIAGPGFINVRISDAFLSATADALVVAGGDGLPLADQPGRVVIDYSSPNLAKEMHVGHLRSTVIGDALVGVLESMGHQVIRQNHAGDWGTQFGMLIEHVLDGQGVATRAGDGVRIADLNALYQEAQGRFEADPDFAERSRARVVKLQAGDEASLVAWGDFVGESQRHMGEVYNLLGVRLTSDDIRPESFYNDLLAGVCEELEEKGVATLSEGALCIFPAGFLGRDGRPLPLIIRKSDGGYGYATTDLAAIRHRLLDLRADRLSYVTDARQAQHFAMLFSAAKMAGWVREGVRLEHVPFGSVLGPDGRPFKTRAGGTVLLSALVAESVERAYGLVSAKSPGLSDAEHREIAQVVGVGAVKYADLVNERTRDYVFDWDRMLSLDGNTSPYLQYAYARTRSIQRRAEELDAGAAVRGTVDVRENAERRLVLQLLAFPDAVRAVADTLEPHRLCTYLFELAVRYTHFYETCPVLRAEPATRASRLALGELAGRVIERGLGMLGIGVLEQI